MSRFIVLAGGPSVVELGRPPDADVVVVAADGGADRAQRAGWPVHHLVGDLDSVSPPARAWCESEGVAVHRHPVDKDASDLELALAVAVGEGATEIDVLLDQGGRLDHLLVAVHVLAADAYAAASIRAVAGTTRLQVIRGEAILEGAVGDPLTLMAIGGRARVITTGLRFALADEWLEPASGRGLSNRFSDPTARIVVSEGVVLAVQPDPSAEDPGSPAPVAPFEV